jgi:DNA-binding NarL/FixJ family response regulator
MHAGLDTALCRRSRPAGLPCVAVLNSRTDFIEALCAGLQADGFRTATAHLADIQSGALDLVAFVDLHDPDAIVYDLSHPYECHWNFLRLLKETDSLKGRTWVLTTIDKEALEAAVGASDVVEIILGEPYGVADVVSAIRVALDDIGPRGPGG